MVYAEQRGVARRQQEDEELGKMVEEGKLQLIITDFVRKREKAPGLGDVESRTGIIFYWRERMGKSMERAARSVAGLSP